VLNTTVLANGFVFLEGPRWRDDKLWFSNMHGHTVYTLTRDGERTTVVDMPGQPSGIGFLPDGTPLIVSMHDRKLIKPVTRTLELHTILSTLSPD
jgi:sugar lactone lactonase YvrE